MQLVALFAFGLFLIGYEEVSAAVNVNSMASAINNKLSSLLAPRFKSLSAFSKSARMVKPKIDFVMLLDSSGSVKERYFEYEKQAAQILVDYIHNKAPIGYRKSRVALIEYSVSAHFEFRLHTYSTPSAINRRIRQVKFDNGGRTATGPALSKAKTELQVNGRSGNVKLVWLITDGYSNSGGNPKIPADQLRAMGATVCVMGVGSSVKWSEVKQIANRDCIFRADSFAETRTIMRKAYSLSLGTRTPRLPDNFFSGLVI
ncbi:collagen alpha-1(XXI) chain-like [Lingula anatina]|uniref:Collagen alpha-1(XXI) chain-like n=1 Tax=Lingula anatina TaxID=7574 RepID=A0A1S3JI24_LINAN|nr:collagen alpha-1(XXI) chain-like [Lingula anatina]|eukprot:XP_013410013.1 collagen alpha-1(XXI) chain-like [Lingula anatina]